MSNEQPPASLAPPTAAEPQYPSAQAPTAQPKPTRNTVGLVALGLAIFGALLAVVPATNGFSWLILLAAFVLAIVGLTRKGQGKATSIIALVVSFLFWIVSIFVGIGVIAGGVVDSIDDEPAISQPDGPSDDVDAPEEEPAPDEAAGVGDTVTTDSGVAVTLVSVQAGVQPPNDIIISEVRGQLVAVAISMANGSDDSVPVSTSSLIGFIGDAEYEAAGVFGTDSGEWYIFEEINPGLNVNFTAYFDIPADGALDRVTFQTSAIFGEQATFTLQ